MYPYESQIQRELTEADVHKRVVMCKWFEEKIEKKTIFGKCMV